MAETDKNKARYVLENVRKLREFTKQLSNRSKFLKETLHQLEMKEVDKMTLETVQHCQEVISQAMTDTNEW